jgi:hypothetical protein
MWLGHDVTFWLAVLALVLMVPVGIFVNIFTPILQNWIATWGYKSLSNRITKLEGQLTELEKISAITEVEDRILMGFIMLRITVFSTASGVVIAVMAATDTITKALNVNDKDFYYLGMAIIGANFINTFTAKAKKGWLHERSPRVRATLRKSIAGLKEIQANWGR